MSICTITENLFIQNTKINSFQDIIISTYLLEMYKEIEKIF